MTERKNEQTVTKWVGHIDSPGGPYYAREDPGDTIHVEHATLFDSPSDVPDDCTPVRVRVETWTEEGKPEEWDGEGKPDGFRMVRLYDDGTLGNAPDRYPTPLPPREAKDALREWHHDYPAPYFTALTAIPVRVPTETKREVTLDPEPTETGCRCLEKVDEMLDDQSRAMAVNYRRGWIDALEAVRRNFADCDCKATETP